MIHFIEIFPSLWNLDPTCYIPKVCLCLKSILPRTSEEAWWSWVNEVHRPLFRTAFSMPLGQDSPLSGEWSWPSHTLSSCKEVPLYLSLPKAISWGHYSGQCYNWVSSEGILSSSLDLNVPWGGPTLECWRHSLGSLRPCPCGSARSSRFHINVSLMCHRLSAVSSQ